jgi:hypothetical protein
MSTRQNFFAGTSHIGMIVVRYVYQKLSNIPCPTPRQIEMTMDKKGLSEEKNATMRSHF